MAAPVDVVVRIEATDLPGTSCGPAPEAPGGHHNIRVGVQRRNRPDELLDPVPADAPGARWDLACQARREGEAVDLRGPYIQGGPGRRFIYLSWIGDWGGRTDAMFRRAKLRLADVPPAVLADAVAGGLLVGRLGLTDARGNPTCAAQDGVTWTTGP